MPQPQLLSRIERLGFSSKVCPLMSSNLRITNANLSRQFLNKSYIRASLEQRSWDRSSANTEREFLKMRLAWVNRIRCFEFISRDHRGSRFSSWGRSRSSDVRMKTAELCLGSP
jgi:hypothetical protein